MFEDVESPFRAGRTLVAAAVYTEIFWIASKLAVVSPALRGTWRGRALFVFFAYGVPFLGTFLASFSGALKKREAIAMVAPSYLVLLRVLWPYSPFPFWYMLVCGCDMWIANAVGLLVGLVWNEKNSEKE